MSRTATYSLIASQTGTGSSGTITFSSIPGTFTDLIVVFNGSMSTNGANMLARFNGDSGSNYSGTYVLGTSSNTAISARDTNLTALPISVSGTQSTHVITQVTQLMDYANTSTNKTILIRDNNSAGSVGATAGLWRSTAAINSISFLTTSGNISSGSTFRLYGIQAVN